MQSSTVDFPAPDGPNNTVTPAGNSADTSKANAAEFLAVEGNAFRMETESIEEFTSPATAARPAGSIRTPRTKPQTKWPTAAATSPAPRHSRAPARGHIYRWIRCA